MKVNFPSLVVGVLVSLSTAGLAQTSKPDQPVKEIPAIPADKEKAASSNQKDKAGHAKTDLKTDPKNQELKIIDGRKVWVDKQGVQSLASPEPNRPESKTKNP